jgi:hypothetical protein
MFDSILTPQGHATLKWSPDCDASRSRREENKKKRYAHALAVVRLASFKAKDKLNAFTALCKGPGISTAQKHQAFVELFAEHQDVVAAMEKLVSSPPP